MSETYNSGYVYCLFHEKDGICRIGMTEIGDMRIATQIGYFPYDLHATKYVVKNRKHAEKWLHNYFNDRRLRRDWFTITPDEFKSALETYQRTIEDKAGTGEFIVTVIYDYSLKNTKELTLKLNYLFQNIVENIVIQDPRYSKYGKHPLKTYSKQRGIRYTEHKVDKITKESLRTFHKVLLETSNALVVFCDGTKKRTDIIEMAKFYNIKIRVFIVAPVVKKKRNLKVA